MLVLSDKWPLFSPQSTRLSVILFISLLLNIDVLQSFSLEKTHLQLCCLRLQSCQTASKRKAQLALVLGKEDFPGTVKSDMDDSVKSMLLSKSVATHSWCHGQSFAAAAGFLAEKQNSDVNHFYLLNAPWQIHPLSKSRERQWNGILFCSRRKRTRSRISSCSWKERERKKPRSQKQFHCIVLDYKLRIQQSILHWLR